MYIIVFHLNSCILDALKRKTIMRKQFSYLQKISKGFTLSLFLFLSIPNSLNATNNLEGIEMSKTERLPRPQFQNALGTFGVDISNSNISVTEFTQQLNSYFELDQNHRFDLIRKIEDKDTGLVHLSYQHFYKDVKINGDMLFIHAKGEIIQYINGQVVQIKEFSTSRVIEESKIKNIAYNNFGTTKNVNEGTVETYILKQEVGGNVLDFKLVNKVTLTTINPLKSINFIIDAQTGEVVSQHNKVYNADTPSTSTTYYRGNKNIIVDSYSGGYRLRDNARNIRTFNGVNLDGGLNNDGTFSGYSEYINSTVSFNSVNTKPAVEVHWAMKETYDYYKNIHNRNSFDGNAHVINNYYDAGLVMGTHDNAAALDEVQFDYELIGMFYGKGGMVMNPVVGLDIAGHEYSHLVISRNGNGGLDYENESGALNESFADMFGTAIEFYVNDNPNWTMGEGVFKSFVSPNYMRNMSDPNSAPASVGIQQPDTYKGDYWQNTTNTPNDSNDYGGVHINSGVGNFWFYLLSEGGSGVNDIGNNYYVDGISIQKAEKIAYKALITGLTPTATYQDAFNATKQAAASLYGVDSNEWNQVVNAWYAVGIGTAPASNQNIEMKTSLTVYPNPVAGNEVTIESNLDEEVFVEMFDMQGKKVMNSVNMMNKTMLNVSSYSKGIYLLKFKSASGEYTHKLMIK